MKIRVVNLGGALGRSAQFKLGASGYLFIVEVYGREYVMMIDCGMETSDDDQASWQTPLALSMLKQFGKIRWMFFTHAHRDHMAAFAVPEVLEQLTDDAEIICTRTTAAFFIPVLLDQVRMSDLHKKKKESEERPYGEREIVMAKRRMKNPVAKPGVIELVPDALSVLVWPAGHIRGACSYFFKIHEGSQEVVVMFSGDYATHDQLTTSAAPLPPEGWYPDFIASFDCTNGAESDLRPWKDAIEEMADDGLNTVKSGEWFCIWAFAMDRCATFAQRLADLGLPNVYMLGPSAHKLTDIIRGSDGFWCEGDRPVSLDGVGFPDSRKFDLDQAARGAIVGPSGMAHGPITNIIAELLSREGARLGSSGYQAPGTNGWRILHTKRGKEVQLELGGGEQVAVRVEAEVKPYRASGHSVRVPALQRIDQLLSCSRFRNTGLPIVGCCHAQTLALEWFSRSLGHCGYKAFRADQMNGRDVILVG